MGNSQSSGNDILTLVGAVIAGVVVVGVGIVVLPFILTAVFVGGIPTLVVGGVMWVIAAIARGDGSDAS